MNIKTKDIIEYFKLQENSWVVDFKTIEFFIDKKIPISILNRIEGYCSNINNLYYTSRTLYDFDDGIEKYNLINEYFLLEDIFIKYNLNKDYRKWQNFISPDEHRNIFIDRLESRMIKNKEGKGKKKIEGYIYIVKSGDKYKIGRTLSLKNRIKKYITENPEEVEIVHTYKTNDYISEEIRLHNKFKKKNFRGEWFTLTEKDIEYIKTL